MLCQDCNEHPAVIMFTQIIDNEKTILRLCKECAEKRGLKAPLAGMDFPISDLLAGMAEESSPVENEEMEKTHCEGCGLTYADFKKTGRLGCSLCYEIFAPGLMGLLRKIHGSNQHLGKIPNMGKELFEQRKEIRRLREQIKKAIKAEEFEKAAMLRDRISDMEKSGQEQK